MTMKPENKILEYLLEAHGKETALIQTLSLHKRVADGDYRRLIDRHLDETKRHALLLQERATELGGNKKPVAVGVAAAQTIMSNSLAMAKGPVDLVRGKSRSEKMLRNARDEVATEALEIATYDTIEALATEVGDLRTAELSRRIRRDEEAMLEALRKQIPNLVGRVVKEQVDSGEPWKGYDDMSAADIVKRLGNSPAAQRDEVARYEASNKARKSIIAAAEKQNA